MPTANSAETNIHKFAIVFKLLIELIFLTIGYSILRFLILELSLSDSVLKEYIFLKSLDLVSIELL